MTAFTVGLHLMKTEAKVHFLCKRRTLSSLKPFSMICSFDLCMALSIPLIYLSVCKEGPRGKSSIRAAELLSFLTVILFQIHLFKYREGGVEE